MQLPLFKLNASSTIQVSHPLYQQTLVHVERVDQLGKESLRRWPREFAWVSEGLAADFLKLHDQSKLNFHPEFLSLVGLDAHTHPFWTLAKFYGRGADSDPELQAGIVQINHVDRRLARAFFSAHALVDKSGALAPEALALLRLERLADVVDTACSPLRAKEFGREVVSASGWLAQRGEHELLTMARELEREYFKIVS